METLSAAPEEKDEVIARRVQAGDTSAFGTLVERYQDKLLRYGKRFLSDRSDIEDIVQDVFLSAYENFQSFDAEKRFSPWIYRIAHNAFVNRLRKASRLVPAGFDFDTLVGTIAYEDPAESNREQREIRSMIERSLEKISPKYREVLILYYLEELDYKEIADVLEVPSGTVGVRLRRGRAALREAYENLENVNNHHATH